MTQQIVFVGLDGEISLTEMDEVAIKIDYDLHSFLGNDVVLDVAFFAKKTNPNLKSIVGQLVWRDSVTDDIILKVQGTLFNDPNQEDIASLWSVAGAVGDFKSFEIEYVSSAANAVTAIKQSDAFNALSSRGKAKISLQLPSDQPSMVAEDHLFKVISTLVPKPSYLGLATLSDLAVYNQLELVVEKINVPLDIELDPSLTKEQAISLVESLDIGHHLVQCILSPNVSRPRGATSLYGRKKPAHVLGVYLGYKQLRNNRTNASGIPPLADPVAGEAYPFDRYLKGLELRGDIALDEADLEDFAQAKINLMRPVEYDNGVLFVLSDILTQYNSKSSALRLVSSADIARYTSNTVINILKRHMLKRTAAYLKDAGRDIGNFLDACYTAGLLVEADDLGGKPYEFSLVPDQQMPFERVRLYLARRTEGATRSAVFDDDVLVK